MSKIGFRFEWCDSHALSVNTARVPASELLWSLRKKVVTDDHGHSDHNLVSQLFRRFLKHQNMGQRLTGSARFQCDGSGGAFISTDDRLVHIPFNDFCDCVELVKSGKTRLDQAHQHNKQLKRDITALKLQLDAAEKGKAKYKSKFKNEQSMRLHVEWQLRRSEMAQALAKKHDAKTSKARLRFKLKSKSKQRVRRPRLYDLVVDIDESVDLAGRVCQPRVAISSMDIERMASMSIPEKDIPEVD